MSGCAPTSAFDTLSSSFLLSLPPHTSQLNPHAAPVFSPSAVSPAASVTPSLSTAPPLLSYASQQSTVYFPSATPPPMSVGAVDSGWRPVSSSAFPYYPTEQMSVQQPLHPEWDPRPFDYGSGSGISGGVSGVRGAGSGLPSLPYSGYPAFEQRSTGRQPSSSSGSNRQMSAGRRRWDSSSRWQAHSHTSIRHQPQQQQQQQPHRQAQQQYESRGPQRSVPNESPASNIPVHAAEEQTLCTQDASGASPALSGVGRLFDPPATKMLDRGLPRPEAIETALDDRRDRKVPPPAHLRRCMYVDSLSHLSCRSAL